MSVFTDPAQSYGAIRPTGGVEAYSAPEAQTNYVGNTMDYYKGTTGKTMTPPVQKQIQQFNQLVANSPSVDDSAAKLAAAAESLRNLVESATNRSKSLVSDALSNIKSIDIPSYWETQWTHVS